MTKLLSYGMVSIYGVGVVNTYLSLFLKVGQSASFFGGTLCILGAMLSPLSTPLRALAVTLLLALNSGVAGAVDLVDRPWLDVSRPYEERLQLFMYQLNITQKYAMVQGDTVVSLNHLPLTSSPRFLM